MGNLVVTSAKQQEAQTLIEAQKWKGIKKQNPESRVQNNMYIMDKRSAVIKIKINLHTFTED